MKQGALKLALGNGIRQNIARVEKDEREFLREAFIAMHKDFHYEGTRDQIPAGGVSYWFKQDDIHQGTHVHKGPAFLPWHRELCNRFEDLLREYNKKISLHYWDWNYDPTAIPDGNGNTINLFTEEFMGNVKGNIDDGQAGNPWLKHGFYNPNITTDMYRSDDETDEEHANPFDPPKNLKRNKTRNGPPVFIRPGTRDQVFKDEDIIKACTYHDMRILLERAHDVCHGYIGGNLGDPHISFRDPFVFLLHSNVDRLFAMWQKEEGCEWRLDPKYVYGSESNSPTWIDDNGDVHVGIKSLLAPWSGYSVPNPTNPDIPPKSKPVRPWAPPENWHEKFKGEYVKYSIHPSVVTPRKYDTVVEKVEALSEEYI
jgi:hypothetical protein